MLVCFLGPYILSGQVAGGMVSGDMVFYFYGYTRSGILRREGGFISLFRERYVCVRDI
jgi:hypothetical protein